MNKFDTIKKAIANNYIVTIKGILIKFIILQGICIFW